MVDINILIQNLKNSGVYSVIINELDKVPVNVDDIIGVSISLMNNRNLDGYKIIQSLDGLIEEDFFDKYKFLIYSYEKKVKELQENDRIKLLSELLTFSYDKVYVIELACLYLRTEKKLSAKRCIISARAVLGNCYEFDLILNSINNDDKEYEKMLVRPIVSEKPTNGIDTNNDFKHVISEVKNDDFQTISNKHTLYSDNKEKYIPMELISISESGEKYPEIIDESFSELIGMNEVKKQLSTIYQKLVFDLKRTKELDIPSNKVFGLNFVIYGNPGTGKTTVARIIGKLLYRLKLLERNELIETDRSGLVSEHIGGTEEKTKEILKKALGATLFIDEAYALYRENSENDFGQEAIDTLLKFVEDNRGELCVILAGYGEEMKNMLKKSNKGFSSRFNYQINIPNYTIDELINILIKLADTEHYKISVNAKQTIIERINKENIDDSFDNGRFMRRLLDEAIGRHAERFSDGIINKNDLVFLSKEDFQCRQQDDKTLEEYIEELNSLIGLQNVKSQINSLIATKKTMEEIKNRKLDISTNSQSLHMIFTGNPGTGKTTVARLLGKIYSKLGILKRENTFVECTRGDLVGEYQGKTALKTKDIINSALGGVLFIDEAYDLVRNDNDSFGYEALTTLIAEMENKRDALIVVLAGYTKEMDNFVKRNSGIPSRFPQTLEFEDYTVDEMVQIFKFNLKKAGYKFTVLTDDDIKRLIEKFCYEENFGNARGVRNIFEKVINNHNSRLSTLNLNNLADSEFYTLKIEDIDI